MTARRPPPYHDSYIRLNAHAKSRAARPPRFPSRCMTLRPTFSCFFGRCSIMSSLHNFGAAAAAANKQDATQTPNPVVLSIAPMMELTDRHYRYMMRLLTKRTQLWTEMIVADTLLHSPVARGYLRFHPSEQPLVCQLGGSDPAKLAAAARMIEDAGYSEINLNCGCPSERVAGKGAFGAALMFTPELVRDCVAAMRSAVAIPVSVKCRLGADDMDSYEAFANFIRVVASGGCTSFVVHARKCHLKGLSPKENRTVPPLRYEWVRRAAAEFPDLRIALNGGVTSISHAAELLGAQPPTSLVASSENGAARVSSGSPCDSPSENCGNSSCASSPLPCDATVPTVEAAYDCECNGDGDTDTATASALLSPMLSTLTLLPSTGENGLAGIGSEALIATAAAAAKEAVTFAPTSAAAGAAAAAAAPGLPPAAAAPGLPPAAALTSADDPSVDPGVRLDSIMIGRIAYSLPWSFARADSLLFGVPDPGLSRRQVVLQYLDYVEEVLVSLPEEERRMNQYKPHELSKPLFNLFAACRNAGKWRRGLQENICIRRLPLREGVTLALGELDDGDLDVLPGEQSMSGVPATQPCTAV